MTTHGTPELEPYLVLAQEIMRRVLADDDPHSLNQWIAQQLGKLGTSIGNEAFTAWLDSLTEYDAMIEAARERAALPEAERRELVWPWQSWRDYLEPLEPGMLVALAAGDGMGKTIYAENIAEYWASVGQQVVFVHFELNKRIMWHRRAGRHTGLDFRTLRDGAIGHDADLERARKRLASWQGGVNYLHTPGWTIEQTIQELRRRQAEGMCDAVVIDYLEKAGSSDRQRKIYDNGFQREADNVELIKIFSETAELPVVLLSQMNKAGKGAGFDTLDRTAIRGAGEKSEKANVVILLHREHLDTGEYSQTVNVRIDKNTIGKTGNLQQFMDAARFRVGDIAK